MSDSRHKSPPISEEGASLPFIAYEVMGKTTHPIVPAHLKRDWMDQAAGRYPYRCLPLVIANQWGWWILNQVEFRVEWNGGPLPSDLTITLSESAAGFGIMKGEECVLSNFGLGILTFRLPYLFRLPAGMNLWVRGPANHIKDGVQPLEGIVEADWLHSTFTMNWKLTRPDHPVVFREQEPICQLFPVERGLLERLSPAIRDVADEPVLFDAYTKWRSDRHQFLDEVKIEGSEARQREWQREYFLGLSAAGRPVEDHQTRLHLKPFALKENEDEGKGSAR